MFAGHVGAAFAIGRAERRVSLGVFVFAALLMDVLLWAFVLAGWESVTIPPDIAVTRQPVYRFPITHGLAAALAWSAFAGAVAFAFLAGLRERRGRAALLVGFAGFSHWILDALVHAPGLPLLGEQSPRIGLGLWRNLPAALVVESLLVVAGIALVASDRGRGRGRRIGLAALTLLTLALTVAGMTVAPPPPSASVMAASSLVTIAVVCALAFWLGRPVRAED